MQFTPGRKLSYYEVVAPLGAGAMGEVYRATDTRLEREVAIKVLPAHFAESDERLRRFEREAKTLASLNHPNVAQIFGVEHADATYFLVLELVPGESLEERLKRGPLPIDEALEVCRQIAEGLEAAHESGVIHRDLKPANVRVTPEGKVKVLDFGLAKPANEQSKGSSTDSVLSTEAGRLLGTPTYMAPEQARGRNIDKRVDVWAFGCVLFECLTAKRAFAGDTLTDVFAAVLEREPDWTKLPAATPSRVRALLERCFAKDPRARLRDIGEARLELERAGREPPASGASAPAHKRVWLVPAGLAVAAALAGGFGLAHLFTNSPAPAPRRTFHVSTTLPAELALLGFGGISPDESFLVCVVNPEVAPDSVKGEGQIMIRRLDRDETTLLAGTEGAQVLSLSPDGRWIAFAAARDRTGSRYHLKKLALVDGQPAGAPETLCELSKRPMSVCWASEREIILSGGWESPLSSVPATGGEPKPVLREEGSSTLGSWDRVCGLGDGKSVLASRWSLVAQTIKQQVEVVDLASGKRTLVLPNAGSAQYLPGPDGSSRGHLVAVRNLNSLVAVPFDANTLEAGGTPVTVWSGRFVDHFALSPQGLLALATRPTEATERRLALVNDQGQAEPIPGAPRNFSSIVVSPDGGRVAATVMNPNEFELDSELLIVDLARRTSTRILIPGAVLECLWSNDGQRITYGVVSDGAFSIRERRSDGAGEPTTLYAGPDKRSLVIPRSWSPDGSLLAFLQVDLAEMRAAVLLLERGADSSESIARPFLSSNTFLDWPSFSPDGKWVKFLSGESGRTELYVQRFTGPDAVAEDARSGRVQVSSSGASPGSWWRADGKEIRYIDTDGQVMSVEVEAGPSFSASLPKPLYSIKSLKAQSPTFAPDGRLLVVLPGENESITKIDLVVNFVEELRAKLAPVK